MANEYCMYCTHASGSGKTLWCNWHKMYVDKLDTCRDFRRHGIALESPRQATYLSGGGAIAVGRPSWAPLSLPPVVSDILARLWKVLHR